MSAKIRNTAGKAVIWDMDGVIVNTGPYHCQSWQYVFKKQGHNFTEEDFQHVFGQRNDTIIRKTLNRPLTQAEVDAIAKDKEEYFREVVRQHLKPFPGVVELLKNLKDNDIASAIASSAPMENIRLILGGLGIEEYFQAIVFGREVTEGKPSPQCFLLAAKKLGVDPRGCIGIEDAVAGVEAVKRAGMHCIAVTNSHPVGSLAKADLIVDSLEKVGLKELNKLFDGSGK
jgi:beta-phosphoglucomutase family hydrolase